MERFEGRRNKTAAALGVTRPALTAILRRHGLDVIPEAKGSDWTDPGAVEKFSEFRAMSTPQTHPMNQEPMQSAESQSEGTDMDAHETQTHGYLGGWKLRESLDDDDLAELMNRLKSGPESAAQFLAGVRRALTADRKPSTGRGVLTEQIS